MIHVIAVNQLANPIRDWVVKIVGCNEPIAMIHLRVEDSKYQVSKEYQSLLFSTLNEARDHIEDRLLASKTRAC